MHRHYPEIVGNHDGLSGFLENLTSADRAGTTHLTGMKTCNEHAAVETP